MTIHSWTPMMRRTSHFFCFVLLLLSSSSPVAVYCDQGGTTNEEVIKDRSPLYESAINLQAVEVDPAEVAHLTGSRGGHRSVRAYPKYVPQANDGRGDEKNYAFAYAVRDNEGGDDFSHKERREGKVTIGEYSVLLPDGRTQVVRYTADGKEGFKADVTYEGEATPGAYAKSAQPPPPPTPAKVNYQSAGSVPAQYVEPEPYRKSYQPVHVARIQPAGPSAASPSQSPVYLSYPLKARRPSLAPSVVYNNNQASQGHIIYGSGGAPGPQSYLASGSNKFSSQVGPTRATYKYYPSPSPNSLYDGPKYSSGNPRVPKVIVVARKAPPTPVAPAPSSLDLGSPYKPIMRGQRAGPDRGSSSVVNAQQPAPVGQGVSTYVVQRLQPRRQYEPNNQVSSYNGPLPSQYFKAGSEFSAGRSGQSLEQQQSVKQVYTHGPSTVSPPLAYSPTPITYVDNSLAPETNYRPQTPFYVHQQARHHQPRHHQPRHHQPQVNISPVKSSVATYTSSYLGVTPKPNLFESSTSPGVEVGRPVSPSAGGLVYISGPRPTPRQLGIQRVLARLPTVSPPPKSLGTKTYELGRPDFGSSVAYSSADQLGNDLPVFTKVDSNQLSSLHDGALREYYVQKKIGAVSGYEEELA